MTIICHPPHGTLDTNDPENDIMEQEQNDDLVSLLHLGSFCVESGSHL